MGGRVRTTESGTAGAADIIAGVGLPCAATRSEGSEPKGLLAATAVGTVERARLSLLRLAVRGEAHAKQVSMSPQMSSAHRALVNALNTRTFYKTREDGFGCPPVDA